MSNKLMSLDGISVSTKCLAEMFGVSTKRIQQLTEEGIIEREKLGSYSISNSVNKYVKYLKKKTSVDEQSLETEKLIEETKLKKAKREKAELELGVTRHELHRTDDILLLFGGMVQTFKAKMLMLAVKVSPEIVNVKSTREIQEKIEKHIYESLEELSSVKIEELMQLDIQENDVIGDDDD